ncbi:TadE family protein [Streptomyces sp. NPDC001941]|uniref:TadE family protein n=1 Tax=Streptomyces sp. NPDC001941 TaxID=3154659 RepID=UPI00331CDA51
MRVIRTLRTRKTGDRGQVAVEFLGMFPLIAVTCILMWQCALLGYTYVLAGNAADEGARQGAVHGGGACGAAAREDLDTWLEGSDVRCSGYASPGDSYDVEVKLTVPVLFPGTIAFPFEVTARASSVGEGSTAW